MAKVPVQVCPGRHPWHPTKNERTYVVDQRYVMGGKDHEGGVGGRGLRGKWLEGEHANPQSRCFPLHTRRVWQRILVHRMYSTMTMTRMDSIGAVPSTYPPHATSAAGHNYCWWTPSQEGRRFEHDKSGILVPKTWQREVSCGEGARASAGRYPWQDEPVPSWSNREEVTEEQEGRVEADGGRVGNDKVVLGVVYTEEEAKKDPVCQWPWPGLHARAFRKRSSLLTV